MKDCFRRGTEKSPLQSNRKIDKWWVVHISPLSTNIISNKRALYKITYGYQFIL